MKVDETAKGMVSPMFEQEPTDTPRKGRGKGRKGRRKEARK
jgi:hypothetical protein